MPPRSERRVIVTGGGTGIGRAIAQAFAADGDQVVLLGRRPQALEQAARDLTAQHPSATIRWQQCDVSAAEEVDAFVRWLVTSIDGPIDVLVNNAGGVDALAGK